MEPEDRPEPQLRSLARLSVEQESGGRPRLPPGNRETSSRAGWGGAGGAGSAANTVSVARRSARLARFSLISCRLLPRPGRAHNGAAGATADKSFCLKVSGCITRLLFHFKLYMLYLMKMSKETLFSCLDSVQNV